MSDAKPLNVRCAEALGAKLFTASARRPATISGCKVTCGTWQIDAPSSAWGPGVVEIPPYGADTPAGWACTGPLIKRFGLRLGHEPNEAPWFAMDEALIGGDAADPCAAIAEWVVEFGAGALRKEKP